MKCALFVLLNNFFNVIQLKVCRIVKGNNGGVAIIFAIALLPVVALFGFVIDYNIVLAERSYMHAIVDDVILSASKSLDSDTDEELRSMIREKMRILATAKRYRIIEPIIINRERRAILVKLKGSVDTFFGRFYGIPELTYSLLAEATAPVLFQDEIYFLLDDSDSLLLAADERNQRELRLVTSEAFKRRAEYLVKKKEDYKNRLALESDEETKARLRKNLAKLEDVDDHKTSQELSGCELACHRKDYLSVTGYTRVSSYELARRFGIKLLADILNEAVANVFDEVLMYKNESTKVGVYYFSENVYMPDDSSTQSYEANVPVGDVSSLRKPVIAGVRSIRDATLAYRNLRGDKHTDFESSLETMKQFIGQGGNGKEADSPRKFLLMITDGVHNLKSVADEQPLNPSWCDEIKRNNVTFAVLYTGYPSLSHNSQYNNGIGRQMRDIISTPGAWYGKTVDSAYLHVSGRDYLEVALRECASPDFFATARGPEAIRKALKSLVNDFLGTFRLTQ